MAEPDLFLLAHAGARRFAIPVRDVAAVLPLPRLTRPPAAVPPPLLGFANVGGRTTPVIAPGALLGDGTPEALGLDAHLVLLNGDPPIAVAVDRATGMLRAEPTEVRPVDPSASANGWLAGEVGEARHAVVRVDRLLLEAERARFAALAALVADRVAASAA